MKLNFRKISAVAASTLLAGMSLGLAAAASYPAPFVSGGSANVAIVYGTGAGVSSLDMVQAGNIQTSLGSYVSGGNTTTVTGEHVDLQLPSSYLHLGDGVADVFGRTITKSDMPTLLADGTYRDGSNDDHDYTQKISVANLTLQQFDLSSYDSSVNTNTPAMGFPYNSGDNLLNYTLTFQGNVNATDMQYSTLEFMGSSYYVLDSTATSLTLLDSSASANLQDGGSTTLTVGNTTYTVSASVYSNSQVMFTINGQSTDLLSKGDTYKLDDGAYVGVKTVAGATYAGGPSTVQFSIGSGKIVLSDGNNVQVNSNSIDGVTASIGNDGTYISSIGLQWDASDSGAITSGNPVTMPTFGGATLAFSGMNYPMAETTTVSNDGSKGVKISTTLKNGALNNFDILGMDQNYGNFTTIGRDSNNLLVTASGVSLNDVARNNQFVVSWKSGKNSESYAYKVSSFSNTTSGGLTVTLSSQDGGSDLTLTNGTASSIGDVVITPLVDYANKMVNFTANSGSTFDKIYTADGLQISLPVTSDIYNATGNNNTYYDATSYAIQFVESNKDGTVASGGSFNITVGKTSGSSPYKTTVQSVDGAGTSVEKANSNVYQYSVNSALASMITEDQGPTQYTAEVEYHGGESYGTLTLAASSAVSSAGASALGDVLVKDSEVSSVSSKNLVIVGGSCINSAAATALGVSAGTCGDAFTAATGVGAGQFLIKGVQDKFSTGKLALVVAGYNADDTVNAATYLVNKPVDTSKTYVGTSGTEATMSTA
jgi:hypothetical protein